MDVQSNDILKQILERLDNIDNKQYKLDRVMERLDTLQNILERQNMKQNLLDQMLVQMTIKLQKDSVFTTEQIQAQQEILEPFPVRNNQSESNIFPHKTAPSLQSWDKIADQLKAVEDSTLDTAQKCQQLTSWSHKMDHKMSELVGNSREMMKTFLVEMRSVKDLIKGQTNSELIWLNNQIDKKLSDIGAVVGEICQQQTGVLYLDRKIDHIKSSVLGVSRDVKTSLATIWATNNQSKIDMEKTLCHSIDIINKSRKEQSFVIHKTLKSYLDIHFEAVLSNLQTNEKTVIRESKTQTNRVISVVASAKEHLSHLINIEGESIRKCKVEMESVLSLINPLLNCMQENLEAVLIKVDSTEASMVGIHQTFNKNLEELNNDLKEYIHKTKREIFAVTEKEAQIVRDRIQGPLPSLGKYKFEVFVNNFKMLIRSGKQVDSLPWHINELQTFMTGNVTMSTNGEMQVWLLYGRRPREVGLQPRTGTKFTIKATIYDIDNEELPPVAVNDRRWSPNKVEIHCNGSIGYRVGVKSCDLLLERGYGEREGHNQGALLIRYTVRIN